MLGNNNIIFIATSSFANYSREPIKILNEEGIHIMANPLSRKLSTQEIIEYAHKSDGIIAGTELYDKKVIKSLSNLKVISRLGVGMDNIDLVAVEEKNIKVFKTKTTPAPSVAELVLGLIIDVGRNISQSNQNMKRGVWEKQMGSLLQGKTLGIIGLGTIGKALIKLVQGFDFSVLAYDKVKDDKFQKKHDVTYCELDDLLKDSDIVSIHLNLSDQTQKLIDIKHLQLMKPNAILINTSRGEIIDECALYDALKCNQIAGAGLDVFQQEPYSGPLTKLNNVVLTPHIGDYAKEIRMQMEIEAAENLIKGLSNE